MRRDKTSVSQEDYLKAIWEMLEEDQVPISARLAEELDVTPPAVTAALKRMTRDGHVRVEVAKGYAATVSSGGLDLLRQPLVLSPGVATPPIDVTVRDDGANVQGEIEHWAEEARAHGSSFNAPGQLPACVYFVPRGGSGGQFRVAWVNDGKFELSQVPPGEYEVLAFDRPPPDLEYESSEAMQKYEGKWQGLHLGPGAKENLKVPLIRTDE